MSPELEEDISAREKNTAVASAGSYNQQSRKKTSAHCSDKNKHIHSTFKTVIIILNSNLYVVGLIKYLSRPDEGGNL